MDAADPEPSDGSGRSPLAAAVDVLNRPRLLIAVGVVALVVVLGVAALLDNPDSNPARLRERVLLSDDNPSELTGAVVSVRREERRHIDVTVDGELICSWEVTPGVNFRATTGGDTWAVIIRRVDRDVDEIDARVDRIPDSGESDGCVTERR